MKIIINSMLSLAVIMLNACNSKPQTAEKPTLPKDSIERVTIKTDGPTGMDKEGMNIDYYSNGKEKMKGILKDGQRHGLWQAWYENGNLWSEAEYSNGINDGLSITYFENGKKRFEGKYEQGKKVGSWIYYDELGNQVKAIKY